MKKSYCNTCNRYNERYPLVEGCPLPRCRYSPQRTCYTCRNDGWMRGEDSPANHLCQTQQVWLNRGNETGADPSWMPDEKCGMWRYGGKRIDSGDREDE